MYARLASGTGWTFGEIDNLTFNEVHELIAYWSETPPAHVSLARIVQAIGGIVESASGSSAGVPSDLMRSLTSPQPSQQGDLSELVAMFPDGVVKGRG